MKKNKKINYKLYILLTAFCIFLFLLVFKKNNSLTEIVRNDSGTLFISNELLVKNMLEDLSFSKIEKKYDFLETKQIALLQGTAQLNSVLRYGNNRSYFEYVLFQERKVPWRMEFRPEDGIVDVLSGIISKRDLDNLLEIQNEKYEQIHLFNTEGTFEFIFTINKELDILEKIVFKDNYLH